MWTDSHCHLDAPEFDPDRQAVVDRARAAGVTQMVIPSVGAFDFETVRALAHAHGFAYALGIHPMYVMKAREQDLTLLAGLLEQHHQDPRLVAVGEIGLDFFVPGLDAQRQQFFYIEQLKLARRLALPVILHVRKSADQLLAGLRRIEGWRGALRTPSTAAVSRPMPSSPWVSSWASAARSPTSARADPPAGG